VTRHVLTIDGYSVVSGFVVMFYRVAKVLRVRYYRLAQCPAYPPRLSLSWWTKSLLTTWPAAELGRQGRKYTNKHALLSGTPSSCPLLDLPSCLREHLGSLVPADSRLKLVTAAAGTLGHHALRAATESWPLPKRAAARHALREPPTETSAAAAVRPVVAAGVVVVGAS
jgi:hypothetical protein